MSNELDKFLNDDQLSIEENPSEKNEVNSLDKYLTDSDVGTKFSTLKVEDFSPYIDDVRTSDPSIFKQRARNQSAGEQFIRTAGNLIPNIGLGLLENAGYLGELVLDREGDYSNALTEWAKEKRNPLGDVYRENPEEVFDMTDPAWWFENFGGLAESIGEFAITGYGIGSLLGKSAAGLNKILKAKGYLDKVNYLGKAVTGAGQLGTSTTLSYLESAQIGSDLYKKVLDETGSKEKAANAAAKAVKLNTALITGLNLTGLSPLFKNAKSISKLDDIGLKVQGKKLSQQLADTKKYIDDLKVRQPNTYAFLAREGGLEALEEEMNIVSERQGEVAGGIRKEENPFESFQRGVFTQEGLLSGILGALGGIGQSGTIKYAPIRRDNNGNFIITRDENGNITNGDKYDRVQEKIKKETYAQNYVSTLETLLKANKDLKQAAKDGDTKKVDQLKNEIFAVYNRFFVDKDGLEAVSQSYSEIANLSNEDESLELEKQVTEISNNISQVSEQIQQSQDEQEKAELEQQLVQLKQQKEDLQEEVKDKRGKSEAVRAGFAVDTNDNEYKEIASQKIAKVQDYLAHQKLYKKEYENTEAAEAYGLANEMTKRYIDLDLATENYNAEKSYYDEQVLNTYLDNPLERNTEPKPFVPVELEKQFLENFQKTKQYKEDKKVKEFIDNKLKVVNENLKVSKELDTRQKLNKQDKQFIKDNTLDYNELLISEFRFNEAQNAHNELLSKSGRDDFLSKQAKDEKNNIEKKIKEDRENKKIANQKKSKLKERFKNFKNNKNRQFVSPSDEQALKDFEDLLEQEDIDYDVLSEELDIIINNADNNRRSKQEAQTEDSKEVESGTSDQITQKREVPTTSEPSEPPIKEKAQGFEGLEDQGFETGEGDISDFVTEEPVQQEFEFDDSFDPDLEEQQKLQEERKKQQEEKDQEVEKSFEEKKADIERRRKEELTADVINVGPVDFVKGSWMAPKSTMKWEDLSNYKNKTFVIYNKIGEKRPFTIGDTKEFIDKHSSQRTDITWTIVTDAKTGKDLADINTILSAIENINEINAKYDEELAALEDKNVQKDQKVEQINQEESETDEEQIDDQSNPIIDDLEEKNPLRQLKIVDAAYSVATTSPKFYDEESGQPVTVSNTIKKTYPKVLMSGKIAVGDELTIEEDTKYVNPNDKADNYQNRINKEEREKAFGLYRPYAIYRNGEKIGYVHDLSYITEARVAETIGSGENVQDNLEIQREALTNLRKNLYAKDNKTLAYIDRLAGETRLSIKSKNEEVSVDKAFNNPNIQVGIVEGAIIKLPNDDYVTITEDGNERTTNDSKFFEQYEGSPVVILPRANSGLDQVYPLRTKDLTNKQVESVMTLVEDFLNGNQKDYDFDITDVDEVRNELNKTVLVREFTTEDILESEIDRKVLNIYKNSDGQPTVKFQDSDKKSKNASLKYASAKNLQKNSELKKDLKDHISKMRLNFQISRISESGYGDYIKKNTTTNIHENRFDYNGEQKYSYFDNPTFEFSLADNVSDQTTVTEEVKEKKPKEDVGISKEERLDIMGGLDLDMSPTPINPESIETLQLLSFKTESEIYKHYNLLNNEGQRKQLSFKVATDWAQQLNKDANPAYRFKVSTSPTDTKNKVIDIYSVKIPQNQLSLYDLVENISQEEKEKRKKECQ